MYSFPIAAVTTDHTFSGLEQRKFIILNLGNQKLKMGFTALKSRCRQGCAAPGGSRKGPIFYFFQLLEPPAFLGLWLHSPSPKPAVYLSVSFRMCFFRYIGFSEPNPPAFFLQGL